MFTLMALFAVALQTSSEGHDDSQLMKCAKLRHCQVTCDSCFKHCLTLTGKGNETHAKTAQYCVDFAECCKACARSVSATARSRRTCSRAAQLLRRLRQVVRKHARRQTHGRVRQNLPRLRERLPRRSQIAQPLTDILTPNYPSAPGSAGVLCWSAPIRPERLNQILAPSITIAHHEPSAYNAPPSTYNRRNLQTPTLSLLRDVHTPSP